jgi:hypothetical protein
MEIKATQWVAKSFNLGNSFGDEVFEAINKFQKSGYEVEIQYQQSNNVVSAFIIGRG